MYYCCSVNLKRQSEHSGLRPDTSSLVFFQFYLKTKIPFVESDFKQNIRTNMKYSRFILNLSQLVKHYFSKVNIIVPTFGTKVTEYLCSGWVFFSSDKFRLFNWPFLTEFFFLSFERYCCPELKFEKIFYL